MTTTSFVKLEEVIILKIDLSGKIIYANDYAISILGIDSHILTTKFLKDIVIGHSPTEISNLILSLKTRQSMDLIFKANNSRYIYTISTIQAFESLVEIVAINLKNHHIPSAYSSNKPISSSLAQIEQNFYEQATQTILLLEQDIPPTEDIPLLIFRYDTKADQLIYAHSTKSIQSLIHNPVYLDKLTADDIDIHSLNKIKYYHKKALRTKKLEYGIEVQYHHKTRGWIWVYINSKYMQAENSDIMNILFTITDIHADKLKTESSLISLYDPITNLSTKEYLSKYFSSHKGDFMAIIYIDLDDFKSINDSLGRSSGDLILQSVVKRILQIDFANITIKRLVADEFVILLEDIETKSQVKDFIEMLKNIFREPFKVKEVNCKLSYSAGITLYPSDGEHFEDLLNNADIAMHKVKESGKRHYRFFDNSFKEEILNKMHIASDLQEGIKQSEFKLYYQPQIHLITKEVIGFEALIRWIRADGTIVPPFKFIPNAEETGLIIPLGTWILKQGCLFINKLKQAGYTNIHVAINISAVQIAQDNFVEKVEKIIKRTQVDTSMLFIELTETTLMKNIEENTTKIRALQDMGIKIALDDFGVGYSSLTYLQKFPIDVLKIEKSFIDDIGHTKKNLVGSIINLGHDLDLKVVAEGVEEFSQIPYLLEYNCDILQGYLFSKPMPEECVFDFLENINLSQLKNS
ncbi:MAG: hypothetical protein BEN19_00285 [Epulopiscium sp. Nuni2H_MBin003]|nr:MAG: hypothetical protein BEN19_00285 [Epulopiscium sp. Nuni2H_MBin003]